MCGLCQCCLLPTCDLPQFAFGQVFLPLVSQLDSRLPKIDNDLVAYRGILRQCRHRVNKLEVGVAEILDEHDLAARWIAVIEPYGAALVERAPGYVLYPGVRLNLLVS